MFLFFQLRAGFFKNVIQKNSFFPTQHNAAAANRHGGHPRNTLFHQSRMLMNCWIIQLLLVATVLLPLVVTALENADVQISHLRPSVMIARGVETITIEGTNFVNDDSITCFFDDEPKAGMWISSTKISCPAPTSTVPRIYQVRVSSMTSLEQQLEVI